MVVVAADRRVDASQYLMRAYGLAEAEGVSGDGALSTEGQVGLRILLARVFVLMGMRRKYAYFLREASQLTLDLRHHDASHRLLCLAARQYDVRTEAWRAVLRPRPGEAAARPISAWGWPDLQLALLGELIELSTEVPLSWLLVVGCFFFFFDFFLAPFS